jgi:hypothetical protein
MYPGPGALVGLAHNAVAGGGGQPGPLPAGLPPAGRLLGRLLLHLRAHPLYLPHLLPPQGRRVLLDKYSLEKLELKRIVSRGFRALVFIVIKHLTLMDSLMRLSNSSLFH